MKTNSKLLFAGIAAAFVLGSCAKEKDKLDKNLVSSEWKVKDFQSVNSETITTTFVDATPNVLEVKKDSSYIIGNEKYYVNYESTKIDGLPEIWERSTDKDEFEQTFTFQEGGILLMKGKSRIISRLEEFSNAPSNNTNFNETASINEGTANWSWGNTDEVKTQFIISQGPQGNIIFNVEELTKTDFIISLTTTNSNTYNTNSNTTVNTKNRMKYKFHFAK